MNINDENSCIDENQDRRRRSKGKRRSSILKMTKSPKSALDDIDINTQDPDEINEKSKKSRRSSSRRVSFAETCQIKEIPNVAMKNTWTWDHEQYSQDENNPGPPLVELPNSCDESSYRQPATTLAGLSSLLSSPIQDSPQKQSFHHEVEPVGQDQQHFTDRRTSLDFTHCFGMVVPEEDDTTADQMDLTANQTLQIIHEQNVLHQTSYSSHEINEPFKPKAIDFLRQLGGVGSEAADLKGNEDQSPEAIKRRVLGDIPVNKHSYVSASENFIAERQMIVQPMPSSKYAGELKVDPSTFLRELESGRITRSDVHNDHSLDDELDFTTCKGRITEANEYASRIIVNKRELEVLDMEMTRCQAGTELKGRNENKSGFGITFDNADQDMEMTRCHSKGEVYGTNSSKVRSYVTSDHDNMDMTRCLAGTEKEARNKSEVGFPVAFDTDNDDMDMTRCVAENESYRRNAGKDMSHVTQNSDHGDMEMTRCLPRTVRGVRNKSKVGFPTANDAGYDDMEMTRCVAENESYRRNGRKDMLHVPQNSDHGDIEITKCLPGTGRGVRNESKIGFPVALDTDNDDMEMTKCVAENETYGRSGGKDTPHVLQNFDHGDMEMTRCLPRTVLREGKNEVEFHAPDMNDEQMEMTRCLSGTPLNEKDKSKVGFQFVSEKNVEDMEITRCQTKACTYIRNENNSGCQITVDPEDMDITRCGDKPGSYGRFKKEDESLLVGDSDIQEMEISRCHVGVTAQQNSANLTSPGYGLYGDDAKPQEVYRSHVMTNSARKIRDHNLNQMCWDSQAMDITCHPPSQMPSEDDMEMTKCHVGHKLQSRDENDNVLHLVDPSRKEATSHTPNTRNMSFETDKEGQHRLDQWNIDISQFAKDSPPTAPQIIGTKDKIKDEGRLKADSVKASSLLNESPAILESNWLKQGNLDRKAKLNLSTTERMISKRRADGELKSSTLLYEDGDRPDDDVPRLSQTLPIKSAATRPVTKRRPDTSMTTNSTWTAPGTHEVVHAGRSIFAAKGPTIGSKLSLLNRKPGNTSMRVENVRHFRTPVSASHSMVEVGNYGDTKQDESCVNTSVHEPSKHTVLPFKSEGKHTDVLPPLSELSKSDELDKEECDFSGVSKSLTLSTSPTKEDSLIMDEQIEAILMPDEILGIEVRTEGITKVEKEEDKSSAANETQVDAPVSNMFDDIRSEITASARRKLSVISEESGVDQSMKGKENENENEVKESNSEVPDGDCLKEPMTLKEFFSMAELEFFYHLTRRSEVPSIEPDVSIQLKDRIYTKCLSDAKLFHDLDNFSKELGAFINENERQLSLKEKELNASNPAIFGELKRAVESQTEGSLIEYLKNLDRVCRHRAYADWYDRRTRMDNQVLLLLKEQEENLSSDLSILKNGEEELDDCVQKLDNMDADYDKKIPDLEALLESQEKEWQDCKEEHDKAKKQLETLELELQTQESHREHLVSENDGSSRQVAEQKKIIMDLESEVERLEQMTQAASTLAEAKKELKFTQGIQPWILEKYDAISMKFSFLCGTFELDVGFDEQTRRDTSLPQRMKQINLVSYLSEKSAPLGKLGHQLVLEKFSHMNFLEMFPTRDRLPELLHMLSEAMARARTLIEEVELMEINHLMSLNDKMLTVEFSSLRNFIKFEINFDLSEVVTQGIIPNTVVKKIGRISSEVISKALSDIPQTVICLSKIFRAADQFLE